MASFLVHHTLEFMDANGQRAITKIPTYHADTTTIHDLVTEIDAVTTMIGGPGAANGLSNAKVVERSFSIVRDRAQLAGGTTPVDGAAYPQVQQKALLRFGNAAGNRGLVSIPAPVDDNIFGEPPGDDLVNAALDLPTAGTTGLSTLLTWLTSHMAAPGGAGLNLYLGGTIKGGKRPRRRATNWV
jgi:hypothetical protein